MVAPAAPSGEERIKELALDSRLWRRYGGDMKFIDLRITRPGSPAYTVIAPRVRLTEIIEEYRLLGWDVSR